MTTALELLNQFSTQNRIEKMNLTQLKSALVLISILGLSSCNSLMETIVFYDLRRPNELFHLIINPASRSTDKIFSGQYKLIRHSNRTDVLVAGTVIECRSGLGAYFRVGDIRCELAVSQSTNLPAVGTNIILSGLVYLDSPFILKACYWHSVDYYPPGSTQRIAAERILKEGVKRVPLSGKEQMGWPQKGLLKPKKPT